MSEKRGSGDASQQELIAEESFRIGYLMAYQLKNPTYGRLVVQTAEALEYATLDWTDINIPSFETSQERKRIHDGVVINGIECTTVQQVCRRTDIEGFAKILKRFKSYHYNTVVQLLRRGDIRGFEKEVLHELGLSDAEQAIRVIELGSTRQSRHLPTTEATAWTRYNKNSWGNTYAMRLNHYYQYCQSRMEDIDDNSSNLDETLSSLSIPQVKAVINESKIVPDMWLEPHDLSIVNKRYIGVLKEVFGDQVSANEMNVSWDWLKTQGHVSERFNGQDFSIYVVMIDGDLDVMYQIRDKFNGFADEIYYAAESTLRGDSSSKGRDYNVSANEDEVGLAQFIMDHGAVVIQAAKTHKGQDKLMKILRDQFTGLYNIILGEYKREVAEQHPKNNIRAHEWLMNLIQTVREQGGATYNSHDDLDFLNHCPVKRGEEAIEEDLQRVSELLPQQFDVNVLTVVMVSNILNADGTYQPAADDAGKCKLLHFLKSRKVSNEKMTENNADSVIETGRLCIHIQLGCQPYAVHKVVSDKPDGVMRHIQSFRYTTDVKLISDEQRLKMYRTYEKSSGKSSSSFPGQLIPASVFTTKGLLSTINGWQEDVGETKESNSSDAAGKKMKRTYQHWETQANRVSESMMRLVAPADIDRQTDHLPKPQMFIKAKHSSIDNLRSCRSVRQLNAAKRYLRWKQSKDSYKNYLSPNDQFQPGKTYDANTLYKMKSIPNRKNQPAKICCEDELLPDVIVLKERSKNGFVWMKEIVQRMFPEGYTTDMSKVHQGAAYTFLPGKGFPVGPKGGNGTMKSATQPEIGDPDAASVAIADPTATLINFPQFAYGTEMHSVVWVFARLSWFFPNHPLINDSDVMCIGEAYFDHIASTCHLNQCGDIWDETSDTIIQFDGQYHEKLFYNDDPNARWARPDARGHFVVMRMLYNTENPPPKGLFSDDLMRFNSSEYGTYRPLELTGNESVSMSVKHRQTLPFFEDIVENWLKERLSEHKKVADEDDDVDSSKRRTVTVQEFIRI